MESVGTIEGENETKVMFTYSEEEKQQQEIDRANASFVFTPKFIPIYPELLDKLTAIEAMLYGFIDFYKSNNSTRMYFSNEQLANIIKCSQDSISKSIKKLEDLGYITTSRKMKAGGGQIRFINAVLPLNDILSISKSGKTHSGSKENPSFSISNKNKIKHNNSDKVFFPKNKRLTEYLGNKEYKDRISYKVLNTLHTLGYIPPAAETLETFIDRLKDALGTREKSFLTTFDRRMIEFKTYREEEQKKKRTKPNWKSKLLNNFNNFAYDN